MSSMLDLVREAVTPDLMRKISAVIGESPGATEKAMGAAVPTILESLADKASTVEGAERLRSMISEGGYGAGMLDKLGATLSGGASESLLRKGSSLISGLFGHRAATIADTIASVAGISRGSSSSLLGLAAPLVMSVLGKQVASRSLDAAGLMGMLTGQRSAITSALPAGLGSLFGAPSAAATAGRDRERVATASAARESPRPLTEEPTYEAPRRSGTGWLLPGLAIAALALLGTLFLSQRRAPDVAERVEPPRPAPAAVAQPTPVTAPNATAR